MELDPITVIIITLLGGDALAACRARVEEMGHALIVVYPDGRIGDHTGAPACSPDVPSRRRAGAEAAATPIVAFLEDTTMPLPGWASTIAQSLADGSGIGAVGGPVVIGPQISAQSAALAICEFGRYQAGPWGCAGGARDVATLPGNNFAFRRDALLFATRETKRVIDLETFAALRTAGWRIVALPEMASEYRHGHDAGAALSTRYHHGAIYGAGRFAGAARFQRAIGAGKAFALPLVLSARALALMPHRLAAPLATGAAIVAQQTAWSAGEMMGALRGESAISLARWN